MVQFNFTYDPSISLEQRVGFELASMIWSSYLTDDVTINLHIASSASLGEGGEAVGGAIPIFHEQNYGVYQEYAEADATSDTDESAVEHLQEGNTVDFLADGQVVDGNTNILLTSAQAKALGMDEALETEGGGTWDRDLIDPNALDGYILVSNAFEWNYDYTRSGEAPEGTLDFMSMALHEIGHQLGFVSGLDGALDLNQLYSGETQAEGFTILDLFRHSDDSNEIDHPDGAVSDLTLGQDSYFSIDGGETNLANFSDGVQYQASHWERLRVAMGIMDPTLAYQERTSLGALDLRAMDVLGWDVNYNILDTGLDLDALLQQAEQAVAADLGLSSTLLTDNRASVESSTFYNLGYGELWTLFEQSMLSLGYGELWSVFELGYGELWQEYGKDILKLGYGELWQLVEDNIFELGYGELWQQFETDMLELGYGELWQQFETEMFELGYGELWQVFEQSMLALGYGELWQQFELGYGELWQEYGNDIFNLGYGELWQLIEDNIFELGYGELWQQFETDMLELGYGELWQKFETDMLELNYGQLWQKLSPFFSTLDNADSGDNAESTQVVSGGFAQVGVVHGGQDDDIIAGSDEQDEVVGGAGDDLIDGKAGDDIIWGDAGNDIIYGQNGHDRLYGGDGNDVLVGEEKGDELYGGGGDDILSGGHAYDILSGGDGRDDLSGGDHQDILQGGDGDDALSGGDDHDLLMGAAGRDNAKGDEGNDVLYGDRVLAESRNELHSLRTYFIQNLWQQVRDLRRENATLEQQDSLGNNIFAEPNTGSSADPSDANGLIRIDAESMTLSNGYVFEGGDTIRNTGTTGASALTTFAGEAGYYIVAVRYFDESGGQSTLTANIGGQTIDSWQFTNDDDQFSSRVVSAQIYLSPGDTIELIGDNQSGELTQVDYIDLIPTDGLLETYVEDSDSVSASTNLFKNGDFSSDLSSWNISQGTVQTVETDAYEGQSLSIAQNSDLNQWVNIFGGQTYQFSAIAKSTEDNWGGIGIQFFDADWQLLHEQTFDVSTTNWTTYQNSFMTDENARYAVVWAGAADHNGQLLIDNVSLQELEETPVETSLPEITDLSSYQTKPWDEGLVAHWSFDEVETNRTRDALNGLAARLDNMEATDLVQGMVGNALSFDGVNEKAIVADGSSLQLGKDNADFSVAFWIKLDADSDGNWRSVLRKGETNQDRTFAIWLHPDDNRIHYRISTTEKWNEGGDSQGSLAVNQWTHVSYVKSGDQLALYLDGQLDSSVTLQGEVIANDDLLRIGSDDLNASIDELKLYDRALSSEDLRSLALYNADLLEGGKGQDTLYGDEGNDQLYGESQNNFELIATQASVGTFDGAEIQVFEHQDNMLLNQGTLSFSFSANEISSKQALLSKDSRNYDDGGHITVWVTSSGRLEVRLQSTSQSYTLTSDSLEDNRTYDAAITFGDRGLELWVSGNLVDTDDYTGGLGANSGGSGNHEPFVFGASQNTSSDLVANNLRDYFSGTLQDVRLFDYQLDETAIVQLPVTSPDNTVFEAFVSDVSDNDVLVGGKGHDTLYGNIGDDILYGDDAIALISGVQYNGSLYVLSQESNWHDAQAEAELLGGNLATINDATEEAWLQQTFGTAEGFWIGLTDEAVEGQFEWVNGEDVTYTNWAPGKPDNSRGEQHYTYINQSGGTQWNDDSDWATRQGIIEIALPEENGNDVMVGGIGNDVLYGELGDDVLDGSNAQARGAYERDILVGGSGADRFILGNANHAYYVENGDFDYVLIRDFNAAEDTIQLNGAVDSYTQQQQGNDTHLFKQGELVAVFENTASVDFNRGFSFS
ncbi:MAG: NF038122 family metalloprotease [Phormidesmis sp.]